MTSKRHHIRKAEHEALLFYGILAFLHKTCYNSPYSLILLLYRGETALYLLSFVVTIRGLDRTTI